MLIEATTATTTGHVYILSGNDDLHVASSVVITSVDTDAVTTWTGTHKVDVAGTVNGYDDGLNFIGCETAQTVTIQSTGRINSGGDGVVEDADGIILDGINSVLTNAGVINSYGSAASLFVRDGGTTTVTNSGTMTGHKYGVWNKFGSGTLEFTNTGTVESPNKSFLGSAWIDHVTNKGMMKGTVDLGGGNDLYDGRTGTVVGSILGGDGDDRFVLGTASEIVDGGAGIDTIDFANWAYALVVNLTTPSLNKGTGVTGDTYAGIENISGGTRADKLTGDLGDNVLKGNAGADTLSGNDGADVLEGGSGIDRLSGGLGADTFVFNSRSGNGDIIYDFASGSDRVQVSAAAFGYGTTTGPLAANDFVVSTSNLARDATDHFIFRTTDATLWFDADGNGSSAAVLLADMQTGATMTAADIYLA